MRPSAAAQGQELAAATAFDAEGDLRGSSAAEAGLARPKRARKREGENETDGGETDGSRSCLSSLCCCCCCGGGAPGVVSARGSYGVLLLTTLLAVVARCGAGAAMGGPLWTSGCEGGSEGFREACRSYSGVLRVQLAAVVFFVLQAAAIALVGVGAAPTTARAWRRRLLLLGGFIAISWLCLPNAVLLDASSSATSGDSGLAGGFAWIARIGALVFLLLQQAVVLKMLFSLQDKLLHSAETAAALTGGGGASLYENPFASPMLLLLLAGGTAGFAVYIAGTATLFSYFSGSDQCSDVNGILSIGLVLPVVTSGVQLFVVQRGSILTSGLLSAYTAFMTYSAVSLHPDTACNPTLHGGGGGGGGDSSIYSGGGGADTAARIFIASLSMLLAYATLSWTAIMTSRAATKLVHGATAGRDEGPGALGGLAILRSVLTGSSVPTAGSHSSQSVNDSASATGLELVSLLVKMSLVFALAACYVAMSLTNWSTIADAQAHQGRPTVGFVSMWVTFSALVVVQVLYMGVLLIPKISLTSFLL